MKCPCVTVALIFSIVVLFFPSVTIRAERAVNLEAASFLERDQVTGNGMGVGPLLSDQGIEIFGRVAFTPAGRNFVNFFLIKQ